MLEFGKLSNNSLHLIGFEFRKKSKISLSKLLATAHPGKFPDTMKLSGISNIPTHHKLSGLLEKKEKSVSLEANKDKVLRFIADNNL